MPPAALLLDLDGTLVDTLSFLFDAFRHAVKPFVTRVPSDEEVVGTFGPSEPECIARFLQRAETEGWAKKPAEECWEAAVDRFFHFYETQPNQVRAFPGMLELVHQAKAKGWYLGVFTGKGRRGAIYTLEQLRLWPQTVECLISSDDVMHPKPNPEGVKLALEKLEVEPGRMLFVGDAPADIEAGKAGGVQTAAALWGSFDRKASLAAGPTYVLHKVSDLQELLDRLFA
jgi:HAD superfamily hydrolase (TIGR01509 family)